MAVGDAEAGSRRMGGADEGTFGSVSGMLTCDLVLLFGLLYALHHRSKGYNTPTMVGGFVLVGGRPAGRRAELSSLDKLCPEGGNEVEGTCFRFVDV